MSKANDRVEWDFLAGVMLKFGFHVDWETLIMRCVATVTYTVGINGGCSASFVPLTVYDRETHLVFIYFFYVLKGFQQSRLMLNKIISYKVFAYEEGG